MTTETVLQQGITAARAGRREEARALLMQVVQADERSEEGWLWLSGVVDDPDDMRTCLQNVLDLNPGSVKAQQGLAWINSRYGPPTTPEPEEPPEIVPVTGATINLAAAAGVAPSTPAPEPAAPPPMPSPPAAQPQLPPAEVVAPDSNPCPYCGTSTLLNQKSCLQCHNSLMIRTAPNEKRSVATTILAVLWGLSGILTVISGLATLGIGIYVGSASGRSFLRGFPGASSLSSSIIITVGVFILVLGGLYVAMARGMLRRVRWAYILHVFFTALSLLGFVADIVLAGALVALLPASRAQALNEGGDSVASLFCGVILLIGYIALTVLSFRDFYGPNVRFQPEVDTADHMGHYNNGVAYKNRGMWYMATREWEAAVAKAPKDLGYLHALGLAYAQIKQFTKARATLDNALSIAPSDARLQESRALVDRLATQR